jgi:hypothetical protein
MQPTSSPPPGIHALAYDVARARTVCIAYTGAGPLEPWEWDGGNWIIRPTPASPTPRGGFGLTYDWSRQRVVLFGGSYVTGSPYWFTVSLNDLWEWDGTAWQAVTLSSPTTPTKRHSAQFVYDARRSRALVLGGCEDMSNWNGMSQRPRADTWELGPDPEATTIVYGRACRGSNGFATLATSGRPELGNAAFALRAASLPVWAPVAIALGVQSASLPAGAECAPLVGSLFAFVVTRSDGSGGTSLSLPVPANPRLLGASVYTQALAPDRTASGFVGSAGLQIHLGF